MIQRNLSFIDGEFIRHNPDAIASSIIELICEDMKFRDMQNDAQYMMLDSRLKDTKKKLKKETSADGKEKPVKIKKQVKERRTPSKFKEKYQERILSIRESDEKAKRRKLAKSQAIKNRNNE